MKKKKAPAALKLDIGCGPNPREGFHGVDCLKFPAVKTVVKLGHRPLPFADDSVDEVWCSHFLEHLTQEERCFFLNDLHRVMKTSSTCTLVVPHWASNRAYGDPTHKWPAISEMFFWYLDRKWREVNAPHSDAKHWKLGYDCDFEFTYHYTVHPKIAVKSDEAREYGVTFYKEAVQDIHATLKPRK